MVMSRRARGVTMANVLTITIAQWEEPRVVRRMVQPVVLLSVQQKSQASNCLTIFMAIFVFGIALSTFFIMFLRRLPR